MAKLKLAEILNYDNPRREYLEPLVERMRRENLENAGVKYRQSKGSIVCDRGYEENPIRTRITSDYAQHLIEYINREPEKQILSQRLAGRILVDLGGEAEGESGKRERSMAHWANSNGLAGYVGVDLFAKRKANPLCKSEPFIDVADDQDRAAFPNLELMVVRADMLDFLMRLQDGTQERGFDYVICGI
ncbi:MAG: hypothetical protein WCT31_03460, partial [Candidatus Micrarchaeia archaeon]